MALAAMARSRFWNCSAEMKEKEPANRSMPPQPASKDGGTKCHRDSFMMRLRALTEPPVSTPRRWPRWAVGAVWLSMVSNRLVIWLPMPKPGGSAACAVGERTRTSSQATTVLAERDTGYLLSPPGRRGRG